MFCFSYVDHFKGFTELVTILLVFHVLAFCPGGMCDPSSPTRGGTCPSALEGEVLSLATREVPSHTCEHQLFIGPFPGLRSPSSRDPRHPPVSGRASYTGGLEAQRGQAVSQRCQSQSHCLCPPPSTLGTGRSRALRGLRR